MRNDFDPFKLNPDNVWAAVEYMRTQCPVAHGHDQQGDFYGVGRYGDVLTVLQDWHTFGNSMHARIGIPEFPLEMGPIDVDPPFQRHLRQIINPFLSPQAVADLEVGMRRVVTDFIEGLPDQPFDIAAALFQPLPPALTFQLLLGLEADELRNARHWVDELLFEAHHHDVTRAATDLVEWLYQLAQRRRRGDGRRGDVLDALVSETVDGGRLLSDSEVAGALMILIMGGFITTTDASSTFLVRLADQPELQAALRSDPQGLPAALEEHLRLVPPVPMLPRLCKVDTELSGSAIKSGDRVGYMIVAANRDPDQFDRPDDYDPSRKPNRHLAFGGGVHRCVGSNFARMSLRVLFEELLARYKRISITPGEQVEWIARGAAEWYNAHRIPVTLVPGDPAQSGR
jgi:cytochrome P450